MRIGGSLFAAWAGERKSGEIGRKLVSGPSFNVEFEQAEERAAEIGRLVSAAIDERADGGNDTAVFADDGDGLGDAAAFGNDVFEHEKTFPGRNGEATSEDERVVLFFGENVFLGKLASDFMADKQPADGWRNHGVGFDMAHFFRELAADLRGDDRILQEQGALEKLPAVQARTENEMPLEKGVRLPKQIENFL